LAANSPVHQRPEKRFNRGSTIVQNSAFRVKSRFAAAVPWVGALAIAFALPAAAQPTIRGRLEAGDKEFAAGRVSDEYPVRVRAGSRLTVTTIATRPLMTAVMMQSPEDGLQEMEADGNPVGGEFEWVYTRDITRDETVTVIVAGMAPIGRQGGSGDYTVRIEAPGGGVVQAGGSPSPRVAETAPRRSGPVPAVITQQLGHFVAAAQEAGFRLVNQMPLGGALNNGTYEDVPISLSARQYFIVGVCDGDCTDMDLRLFAPNSSVAEDVADDDSPMLAFTAATAGEHRLRVMMPACSSEPCAYGISIYMK
jgi:hypothetical protein